MKYQLVEPELIDLTRHVRTAAGAARYHKPIGSPIGGGGVAEIVPPIRGNTRLNFQTMASPKKVSPLSAVDQAKKMSGLSVIRTSSKKQRSTRTPIDVHLTTGDANDVRKSLSSDVDGSLWKLDPQRLSEAMKDPNITPDRLRAMKREQALRFAKAKELLGPNVKEGLDGKLKKAKSAGAVTKLVHEHAPAPISKLYDIVTHSGTKVKDADHAQSVVDAVWDFAIKASVSAALLAIFHVTVG